MIVPDLLERPIVLIDIGAVGNPPSHWSPLRNQISLIGFEPNKEECKKLNASDCGYRKSKFLPYAIGEKIEKRSFYITDYHECCSLLKPNHEWLQRFEYGSFFNVNRTSEIETLSLDSIEELSDFRVDAIKIDAQGNELPILKGDELCPYLNKKGFTCMEVFTQPPQKRKNKAREWKSAKGQAMACESIWVRDLIKCEEQFLHSLKKSDFLSILSLCWLFGYIDYALELIDHEILGLKLEEVEKTALLREEVWMHLPSKEDSITFLTQVLGFMSHLLPTPARRNLYIHLPTIAEKPNKLKRFLGKG
jgi:FkbM family methyltransferase